MEKEARVRAVIVEGEPRSRQYLLELLLDHSDVTVVAECSKGIDALGAIDNLRPDVVFIDVQLPDIDGFGVLDALRSAHVDPLPLIVFTTSYDRYALKAFEHHAFDYLVKPFGAERFRTLLNRVREHLQSHNSKDLLHHAQALLKKVRASVSGRLIVKSNGRFVFLKVDDIICISAEGNYIRLHLAGGSHLIREAMNRIEQKLDPTTFIRVHRSWIVNLAFVREIRAAVEEADGAVVLNDGTRLSLSRGYRARIDDLLVRDAVG